MMAEGSRKKHRPSGKADARKKNTPISKEAGDDPAPPPVPSTSTTSAEGDKKRPDRENQGTDTATAASGKRARGSGAGDSMGSGGLSLGEGADGVPAATAAAAAVAAAAAAAVGGEKVLAGAEGENPRGLALSSPTGGGAESVAVANFGTEWTTAAAAAAGLEIETVSEEELDASMCSEMDEWIAVVGGAAPEGEDASLRPQGDDDAHGNTGPGTPEARKTVLASASAAAVAEAAAAADGGKSPDRGPAPSLQGSDGEGIGIGAEVEERSASVKVVGVEGAGERSEPPAEAGAVPNPTAAPPFDFSAAPPDPAAQAETASLTATAIPALEQGLKEGAPPTKDTPAGAAGVAIVETPAAAAATAVSVASASEPPGVAVPAGPALPAAGRDRVDGVEEPQPPPPSAAAPTAAPTAAAAAGGGAIGTRPASDALKEDVAVGGAAGSEQKASVAEVLPKPAPPSTEAATETASTGGSGSKEKAAAAEAAAEAAAVAAVLASADVATAAEAAAAAAAIADAEAALKAVPEAEAGPRPPSAERDGADSTAALTTTAPAAEEGVAAAVPASANKGKAAQERTAPHAAAAPAAAAASDAAAAASDAAAAPAAAPSVAAFPPLFLETRSESSEAAPAGAVILIGSVSADVFSSRSAGGCFPWPGSSEGSSDGSGGSDDGFGGSSRHGMSVQEAAAFLNLGSTGGRGSGARFASESSWPTTSASAIDTTAASAEVCAVPVSGAAAGGGPGGALSSIGSLSRHGSFLTVGGAPSPFVGPDDFLSPSSVVGMGGLNRRRLSADAVVLQGFSSGGGVALGGRSLGARRATASEMGSRGGGGSGTASVPVGGPAVGAGPETSAVVVAGAATGRINDGDPSHGGGMRSSPSTKDDVVGDRPSAAQEAQPALLVRKGEAGAGSKTAVVGGAAVTAGHGESSAAAEGGAVVKNSGSGGDLAAGDSAATSCAGGEGGVGSPPPLRGADAEAAVSGPSGTGSSGGCCVVS